MATPSKKLQDVIYDLKHMLLITAARDPAFRAQIISDGQIDMKKLVIPDNVRELLPKQLQIQVREDTEDLMHLVVPTRLDDDGPTAARAVIAEAVNNPSFRKTLEANPRQTLEAEIGIELPNGLEFKVLSETARLKYLVLPADVPRLEILGGRSAAEVYAASGWCGQTFNTVIINLCGPAGTHSPPECDPWYTTGPLHCEDPGPCDQFFTYHG